MHNLYETLMENYKGKKAQTEICLATELITDQKIVIRVYYFSQLDLISPLCVLQVKAADSNSILINLLNTSITELYNNNEWIMDW